MSYEYDIMSTRTCRESVKIAMPSDAIPVLMRYAAAKQEQFLVIILDGNHQVIAVTMTSLGLVNRALVHPREIFKKAILMSATAIIIAHNHPSGCTDPSHEDRDITKRVKSASQIIGIQLLDSIIFTGKNYYSFLDNEEL